MPQVECPHSFVRHQAVQDAIDLDMVPGSLHNECSFRITLEIDANWSETTSIRLCANRSHVEDGLEVFKFR